MKRYKNTDTASFPLGGIGCGSIGLGTDGSFKNFEIFNRPDRESVNAFSHFAVKAERNGKLIDFRVLKGDGSGSAMGKVSRERGEVSVWGNGTDRGTLSGLRHFRSTVFRAFCPVCEIGYIDPTFPAKTKMAAFSPFIPMNSADSSIPCAFFEIELENTETETTDFTVAFSLGNPFPGNKTNRVTEISGHIGIALSSDGEKDTSESGSMTVTALDGDVSYQEYWYRGGWFDELTVFLKDFKAPGKLVNRTYDSPCSEGSCVCTVASSITLKPKEKKTLRFAVTWYCPIIEKYWDASKPTIKSYVASRFDNSDDVMSYCIENYGRLKSDTYLFVKAIESQTLPASVKDALGAAIAVAKSSTVLRLSDGTIWGWEGITEKSGSCEGTCTHVWNYAALFPMLFPDLERSIRNAEFKYSIDRNGKMAFRMMLPPGSGVYDFRACADGQFGTVIKTYREWMLGAGDEFLREKWDKIRSLISYSWSDKNPDRWDSDRRGVLTGRCHHTLDMELFAPSSWLQSFYLAALKAALEMAKYLGDTDAENEYFELLKSGRDYTEKHLFKNGYYCQDIDPADTSVISEYQMGKLINSEGYLDPESGEIKYQIGEGLAITAVEGDRLALSAMLGGILAPEKIKSTLEAIMRYNFKSMRNIDNPCRIFASDDDFGTVTCSYDGTKRKPAIPIPYAEECMTGFEYAAASEMIRYGMLTEGETVVKAVRDRYNDGRRDPFAELECGAAYARSMACFDLISAYSGLYADLRCENTVAFAPVKNGTYFWSLGGAFGNVTFGKKVVFGVMYGEFPLSAFAYSGVFSRVLLNGRSINAKICESSIPKMAFIAKFEKLILKKGDKLTLG